MLIQTKRYKIQRHALVRMKRLYKVTGLRILMMVIGVVGFSALWFHASLAQMAVRLLTPFLLIPLVPFGFMMFKFSKGSRAGMFEREGTIEFSDDFVLVRMADGCETKMPWSQFQKAEVQESDINLLYGTTPIYSIPEDAFAVTADRQELIGFLLASGLTRC
jgi:hypothetical protein